MRLYFLFQALHFFLPQFHFLDLCAAVLDAYPCENRISLFLSHLSVEMLRSNSETRLGTFSTFTPEIQLPVNGHGFLTANRKRISCS